MAQKTMRQCMVRTHGLEEAGDFWEAGPKVGLVILQQQGDLCCRACQVLLQQLLILWVDLHPPMR